jgi:SAM-dependent methyltransferase
VAHREQLQFVRSVKQRMPAFFTGRRVLEVGSRHINGSVRALFADCDYLGIDSAPGDNVDLVTCAHQFDDPSGFDVVVCCEVLEHDPWIEQTLASIVRLVRPGGMFIGTCAGPLRPEHGTRASTGATAIFGPDADYYRNVSTGELAGMLLRDASWDAVHLEYGRGRQDLYWYAING